MYALAVMAEKQVPRRALAPGGRAVPAGREVARRTKNPGLQYGFRIPLATPEET